jgi:hypothetical protein
MRGWILNAPTCATPRPGRSQGGYHVAALFGGGTGDWGSTTQTDYLGGQNAGGQVKPWLPSPRGNLLYGGEEFDRFQCTSHAQYTHPGRSPREIRRIHSNAPSEPDHPLFGLHDPMRKKRLGRMMDTSLTSDTYLPPRKTDYVYSRADPPYPDTAHESTSFDHHATMGMHKTEQQSKFSWPTAIVSPRSKRPLSQLVIT